MKNNRTIEQKNEEVEITSINNPGRNSRQTRNCQQTPKGFNINNPKRSSGYNNKTNHNPKGVEYKHNQQ